VCRGLNTSKIVRKEGLRGVDYHLWILSTVWCGWPGGAATKKAAWFSSCVSTTNFYLDISSMGPSAQHTIHPSAHHQQRYGWKGFPFAPPRRYLSAPLARHIRLNQIWPFGTSDTPFPTRRRSTRSTGEAGSWRYRHHRRLSSSGCWTRKN
jgi:hypothetical protein